MSDVLTREQRSYCMSQIHGKDTKPEMVVRRVLHGMGYRYRLHAPDLPGKPDIVFRSKRKIVFVHGCYWHRHTCKYGKVEPRSRQAFWLDKFAATIERDRAVIHNLRRDGWKVLVVWECQTKIQKLDELQRRLDRFLGE